MQTKLSYSKLVRSLPSPKIIKNARRHIQIKNSSEQIKIVVLDDDPTGCQTVHDIKILMNWDRDILKRTLEAANCFYILTNSRAYPLKEAVRLNAEIITNLSQITDFSRVRIISRSDSTLRGHFLAETDILADYLGPFDGLIVVPYFKEGGRLTINDTHYIKQENELIPAHLTEFSQDPVFGFKNAYLPKWIEEKSNNRWHPGDVVSISIADIRAGGEKHIYQKLIAVQGYKPVIVNAITDEDLEIFVLGLNQAEADGKKFLYRTAASFVKIRAGIAEKNLIKPESGGKKGLIIVGSFIQKSTDQLNQLLQEHKVHSIEVRIQDILMDVKKNYLSLIQQNVEDFLKQEEAVVLFTERKYGLFGTDQERLNNGKKISDFLSQVTANLSTKPDFVIAKGGITSHDIAKKGFGIKEATVLGQVLPGVPVWKFAPNSTYPGMFYVVFPGNVGDKNALNEAFNKFYVR
jgi:uncharacterized protein YgbK (DUF1537 family)